MDAESPLFSIPSMNLSAVSWAGKDMNGGFVRVAEGVKEMSKRMPEGRGVSPEKISAAVSDLRKVIESLRNLSAQPG